MRAQDEFLEGVVHAIEDGVVAQQAQHLLAGEEALAQFLQPEVAAVYLPAIEGREFGVPGCAIFQTRGADGEGDGVLDELGDVGRVGLLHLLEAFQARLLQLGRLVLDEHHRQAVDVEHHVQPPPVPVLEPDLFAEVEGVVGQVLVVDEGNVVLALLGVVVRGPLVAQGEKKLLVALQVGRQQAQTAFDVGDARVAGRPAVELASWARSVSTRNGSRRSGG